MTHIVVSYNLTESIFRLGLKLKNTHLDIFTKIIKHVSFTQTYAVKSIFDSKMI